MEHKEIVGKYRHNKGRFYFAIGTAYDQHGKCFVLYQQDYGDKSFWIRPYNMFFDSVECGDGSIVERFHRMSQSINTLEKVNKSFLELLKKADITIKYSESDSLYSIIAFDTEQQIARVCPIGQNGLGYLTDYELASRMGYSLVSIDGENYFRKQATSVQEVQRLEIDDNAIDMLEHQLNPCSIDLQIADSGFLKARWTRIDLQSIKHMSQECALWKTAKLHQSKNVDGKYIVLFPGQTILTHTKNRIRIPDDCAGKIEIKSTYARLSLSVTFGDFCNPGYNGYFPLQITNFGKHIIVLHAGEMMLQLMLIGLSGQPVSNYEKEATHINNKGFDEGTPYAFWRERAIKKLRTESGAQPILDFYHHIINNVHEVGADDINAFRERFSETFLAFCQKKKHMLKYQVGSKPNLRKLVETYIKREKGLRKLYSCRIPGVILSGFVMLVQLVIEYIMDNGIPLKQDVNRLLLMINNAWLKYFAGAVFVVSLIFLLIRIKKPGSFCTFERHDIMRDITTIEGKEV